MAFMLQSTDVGQTPPIEYRQATAEEDVVMGEALVTAATGLLTKCGATARPEFIAVGPQDEHDCVPVVRVQDYQVWRTQLSAAGTSLKPGNKVTLEADGHDHQRRGRHRGPGGHRGGRQRPREILIHGERGSPGKS